MTTTSLCDGRPRERGVAVIENLYLFPKLFCRTSSQKYSPLDWSDYFDREEDVSIPDSNDVSIDGFHNSSILQF